MSSMLKMPVDRMRKALVAGGGAALFTAATGFGQALIRHDPLDRDLILGVLGAALVAGVGVAKATFEAKNEDAESHRV